jgi:hypothetical protein
LSDLAFTTGPPAFLIQGAIDRAKKHGWSVAESSAKAVYMCHASTDIMLRIAPMVLSSGRYALELYGVLPDSPPGYPAGYCHWGPEYR